MENVMVYPRMGGGNAGELLLPSPITGSIPAWAGETCTAGFATISGAFGLSPHGRGKPVARRQPSHRSGSIPAWAGETPQPGDNPARRRVYPRMGGGNFLRLWLVASGIGLSPHGQGKRPRPPCLDALSRSIPAWAGETSTMPGSSSSSSSRSRDSGSRRPALIACSSRAEWAMVSAAALFPEFSLGILGHCAGRDGREDGWAVGSAAALIGLGNGARPDGAARASAAGRPVPVARAAVPGSAC